MSANFKASTDGTQAIIGVGGVDQMTVSNAGVVTANSFVGAISAGNISSSTALATGSTTARTLANRFADVVNVKDFGDNLSLAIDSLPTGAILQLNAGTYTAKFAKTRSDITIIGAGMPSYNSTKTALVGGTIIKGTFDLNGDRIKIELLGVDSGLDACNLLNSGNSMDALVIRDPARSTRKDVVVRDVITLCKDPLSPAHCFLFEGVKDSHFENLHARYGQWGIVFKTNNCTADGLYAYANSEAGVTIKSDSYAIANTTSISNIVCLADDFTTASNKPGILLYAATASMRDVAVSNFYVDGFPTGFKVLCNTRLTPTNLISNYEISNGSITNCKIFGFESFGAGSNGLVSNVNISDTVSGNSIKVWSDCLGLNFTNVTASSLTSVNNLTNVDLAGRFSFDQLFSIVGGDISVRSGINIVPDSGNRAVATIGSYVGDLYVSGILSDITLSNGWSEYFSTSVIRVQSGRAQLYGRLAVPPTPWTGKEVIGTIPAALAPFTDKYYITLGYSSTTTYPIYLTISQTGEIKADFLNTPSQFPTSIVWIGLDNISWLIPE